MRVPLTGKPYTSKSIIASNQRSVNLYAEINNDPQAPCPLTLYPMPGTTRYTFPNTAGRTRCTYRTSLGTAYCVIGTGVYYLANNGALVLIGNIPDRLTQVIMADNGLAVVLVDGTEGWAINIVTNDFGQIIDAAFYGADYALFLDTFFCFNRPDTNQFYITLSMVTYAMLIGGTAFDPLDIAAKAGSADPIVALATTHKELWLIGELTTEVWIGTGAADFYFQLQQGAYIDHGCAAQYSVVSADVFTFWIMQDKQGNGIIVKGANYQVAEVSTPAIVSDLKAMADFTDCVAAVFQMEDHAFVVFSFPTSNKTYTYDLKTELWAEWSWLNTADGTRNRHRIQSAMFVYGMNLIGDWETGTLWKLDPSVYTNAADEAEANVIPIIRTRTFLHMVGDNYQRVSYLNFDADMECGTTPQIDEDNDEQLPMVDLSWSDDRGKTFGYPVQQSLGNLGNYLTTVSWNRLGQARDRVFKLEWSAPVKTALNGAFVELVPGRS